MSRDLALVAPGRLTLGCGDLDAMPLMGLMRPDGTRPGYEPDAAALVAARLGLELTWVPLEWSAFYSTLHAGRVDGIWCGQGITDHRRTLADFTRPYAVFNESLVTRIESTVASPADCAGLRIGAIAESTNMALTETFPGAIPVPFDGATDDVYADMIAATRSGEIDGFVDDDVVMVTLDADPELRLAFTVETRNRWGIAVRRGDDALRTALDDALDAIVADGSLEAVWRRHMPDLPWPFGGEPAAMARRPLIGLTAFRRDLPTYLGECTDLYTLDPNYADGVIRAGGLPLIIPHGDDPDAVLDLLDGLVLTGGGDLHPEHYGAATETELEDANAGADVWELALARGVRARGLPTLGICRGMQALAVVSGGRMVQDLRPEHGHPIVESTPEALMGSRHPVDLDPASAIAAVLGTTTVAVNSIHHQAVVDAGDLVVTGRVGDVVEALESGTDWSMIGVQWHPEKMDEVEQERLFRYVVDAARDHR